MPAIGLGQITADSRPDRGRESRGERIQRQADRLLRLRQLGQHERKGHGNQHAAGEALQRPQNDHLAKVARKGAGHGEDQEQNSVGDEIAPEREDATEIVAQRNDNDLTDEIRGRDPGAVVDPGADATLDVEQRRIGNLDVQHRHEGAK